MGWVWLARLTKSYGYLQLSRTTYNICIYATCRNNDEPVFEVPPEKYSAEAIVRTLLDPRIDQEKISKKCPLNIQSSATYVVDLDLLKHPDDVKKDNFGVWTHSGSHYQKFEARVNAMGNLEIGKGVFSSNDGWKQFSLRRLHSKHPMFRRILSFITGM